ncbi:hypothetical protein PIB30_091977 [Stylosanthes scabra]|uniref:RNase H type-1 domain-containing protein n=1 Tax=Stylosanthes scabra TaxID=79078 RepID=A0ABU6RW24_9FABA|nr:hypothetical protein [Stylosanthes scabra]
MHEILDTALNRFGEFIVAAQAPPRILPNSPPGSSSPNSWIPPPPNLYKLNFDAVWSGEGKAGAGAVIRSYDGVILMAAHWEISSSSSVDEAEASACFLGLKLALEGLRNTHTSHVKRDGNRIANCLAKLALLSPDRTWTF